MLVFNIFKRKKFIG